MERMHEGEQQDTDSGRGYYFTCRADGAVHTLICVFTVERVAGGGRRLSWPLLWVTARL